MPIPVRRLCGHRGCFRRQALCRYPADFLLIHRESDLVLCSPDILPNIRATCRHLANMCIFSCRFPAKFYLIIIILLKMQKASAKQTTDSMDLADFTDFRTAPPFFGDWVWSPLSPFLLFSFSPFFRVSVASYIHHIEIWCCLNRRTRPPLNTIINYGVVPMGVVMCGLRQHPNLFGCKIIQIQFARVPNSWHCPI